MGRILQETFGVAATSRCIPGQPFGVYDEASLMAAAPKVVKLARDGRRGRRALIISCASEPGMAETRALVVADQSPLSAPAA